MEKELGQIKFTETDDGLRVDIKGKSLKEMFSCCCVPVISGSKQIKIDCCPSDEEKKS